MINNHNKCPWLSSHPHSPHIPSCISSLPSIPNHCPTSHPFSLSTQQKKRDTEQKFPPLLISIPMLNFPSPKRWLSSPRRLANPPKLWIPPSPGSSGILFHQMFYSLQLKFHRTQSLTFFSPYHLLGQFYSCP